jgi:hypothetical protein
MQPAPILPGLAASLLRLLPPVVVVVGVLKVAQALLDEEFEGRDFPAAFREELIARHVEAHGCRCPECRRRVSRTDLTVDHIVAFANGGLTSRANAQVLCMSCNASKGAKNSMFDRFWGRSR